MAEWVQPRQKGGGYWSGIQMGPRPVQTLVLGVSWSLSREHSFSLGLNGTLFQAAMYNIKICIMENIEKVYTETYCSFSDSEAAIKALDNVHINYSVTAINPW